MDKGIYTALSGGIAQSHEMDLIANNLANATTSGFKRDTGTFNEYLTQLRRQDTVAGVEREITAATLLEGRPQHDKSFVEMDAVYTDFSQGSLRQTNRSLDSAIKGEGFFEVLTPSGVQYTRQGNLSLDAQGRLVTLNGFPVLGGEGADVSAETAEQRVITLGRGPVSVSETGEIFQNGQQVGSVRVVQFAEQQWLEKVGNSYFRNTDERNLVTKSSAQVAQGFLEGSNVNAVREMTRLIQATRSYESHMQAIKTYQEIDSKSVNELARG